MPALVQVGRYQIIRQLGAGGYGLVFLAYDPTVSRQVALKIARPEFAFEAKHYGRFLDEARLAGNLDHPGIVQVYDAGEVSGVWHIASEFCEGPNLSQWLRTQPDAIAPRAIAALLWRVCQAMSAAHLRGIIHRDLKPANILLVQPPEALGSVPDPLPGGWVPKVTDFGLAKLQDSVIDRTQTGFAAGTPQYMAPEQADRSRLAPTLDVWSLGVILYELLTGVTPFRGDTVAQTLRMIEQTEPIPPHQLRPAIPTDLVTICLKCMEKNPARRYANASELGEELARYLEGRTILARPATLLSKSWKWCQRNRGVAVPALLLSVSILVGLITSSSLALLWATEAELAKQAAKRSRELQLDAQSRAVKSLLVEARAARRSGNPGGDQRFQSERAIQKAIQLLEAETLPEQAALRDQARQEFLAAQLLSGVEPDRELDCPRLVERGNIIFDADYQRYAYALASGEVEVRNFPSGDRIALVPLPNGLNQKSQIHPFPMFLTDQGQLGVCYQLSSSLARGEDHPLVVWQLDEANVRECFRCAIAERGSFNLSDDQQELAIGKRGWRAEVRRLPSGERTEDYQLPKDTYADIKLPSGARPRGDVGIVSHLALHPSKPKVAITVTKGRQTFVFDRTTGQLERTLKETDTAAVIAFVGWTHQSDELLVMLSSGRSQIWNVATGQASAPFVPMPGPVFEITLDHSRCHLAASGGTGLFRIVHLPSRQIVAQMQIQRLYGFRLSRSSPLLGTEVITDKPRLWKYQLARHLRKLPVGLPEADVIALNPQDNLVLASTLNRPNLLQLWDLKTASFLQGLRTPGRVREVIPHPDQLTQVICEVNTKTTLQHLSRTDEGFKLSAIQQEWPSRNFIMLQESKTGDCRDRLIVQDPTGGTIYASGQAKPLQRLPDSVKMKVLALDPTRDWLASYDLTTRKLRVEEYPSGKTIHQSPEQNLGFGQFSPCGRRLLTFAQECKLWQTDPWRLGPTIAQNPGSRNVRPCFSPDGNWIALPDGRDGLRFIETATGRDSLHWEMPIEPTEARWSADGRRLSLFDNSNNTLVLDLHGLQQELVAAKLGPMPFVKVP